MAMLKFLHCCLGGSTSQKKMFFKVHVLYIDETVGVFGESSQKQAANIKLVQEACDQFGF